MPVLKELLIPHMGSVENAKLISWHVAEGAPFRAGQVLYEIETDKTVTEVPAEEPGFMARYVAAAGAELKVGDLIAWTTTELVEGEDLTQAISARSGPSVDAQMLPSAPPVTGGGPTGSVEGGPGARISPRARRLAKERGVDLALVGAGTSGGRISGEDVLRCSRDSVVNVKAAIPVAPSVPGYENVPVEFVTNSTRRRAIARRLAESVRNAPHLTADMQVDLTSLMSARAALNASLRARGEPVVSILSFVSHSVSRLLLKHVDLNASFLDECTLRWKVVNLGIAVDTPEGLVVPVIRDAASRSLEQINAAIATLAQQARLGKLSQADLEGGTFSISNPGSIGPVLRAEAILNPPQVALLGLPGIQYVPVAVESSDYRIEVRPILRPSVTFDHRALDGGQVIRFLNDLKADLEHDTAA
jgi:pyruvate/2-oxoglutarate dehydrogenase complex dihydrolipoamide acyltransferase (E2) component